MEPVLVDRDHVYLERLGLTVFRIAGIIGIAALVFSFVVAFAFEDGLKRFLFSYLTNYCYFISYALGALFFVTLQHLTRSGWSVVVRRLAEIMAATIPIFVILFLPIFLGLGALYPWADQQVAAQDHLIQWKRPYLNIPFFMIRTLFYFAVWWFTSHYLLNRSVEQDKSGDAQLTLKMEKWSAPIMILFALTITFASFDWLMSLDPHWFSTIFGVYYFAGSVTGFFALITLVTYLLQQSGRLVKLVTVEHYHDYGKLLFGFVFFWGYIAFSQYMLIWYANIPEETGWIFNRTHGPWTIIGVILILGHFAIPFLGLISRYAKRRKIILTFWAVWMLVMHWIDLYWLVMPEFKSDTLPVHIIDLGCLLGIGGLFVATIAHIARGKALIPLKDPRLHDSLTFENA